MIVSAIQRGIEVFVYHTGGLLYTVQGELQNHTDSTVTVKRRNSIYVYDEQGRIRESRMENTEQK